MSELNNHITFIILTHNEEVTYKVYQQYKKIK